MDIATIMGALLGVFVVVWSIGFSSLIYFWDMPSVVCVFGGTVSYLLMNFPLKSVMAIPKLMMETVKVKPTDLPAEITRMVEFATIARRDGLLALEEKLGELKDPFLLRGIQMIIDGVAPESVRSILEIDLGQMAGRHSIGKGILDAVAAAAPAFGMIGTLMGLVLMLQNLSDPSALGPGMAVALITTFYGAVIANMVYLPMAGKLGERNKEEILARQVMIEGVLAIQAGENPNVIRERLNGFVPPPVRVAKK